MADTRQPVITNRDAYYRYEMMETFECGIALAGTEVKAIRDGQANLKDAYALVRDGEVWLLNAHINPYTHGNRQNHDPRRTRKLLLHKREIDVPLYAFSTSLTQGRVAMGARRLVEGSRIRRDVIVDDRRTSHLDPLSAAPRTNRFLKTVVPFLKRTAP